MTTDTTSALQAFADSCEWEFTYQPHKAEGPIHEMQLKWTVRVTRNRHTYETQYYAGIGHIPNVNTMRPSVDDADRIRRAVETGLSHFPVWKKPEPITPNPADVLACLASDAGAIDSPTYEEWAGDLGYDPDSRSGEKTYRACIETAMHLRRMFGDEFDALREAAADW